MIKKQLKVELERTLQLAKFALAGHSNSGQKSTSRIELEP